MSRYFRNRDWNDPKWQEHLREYQERRHRKGSTFGVILLLLGVFILAKMFVFPAICWESIWPFLLIAIGFFIGIKSRFCNVAWWILIFIGVVNLIPAFMLWGHSSEELVAPAVIILAGLFFILRPKKNWCPPRYSKYRRYDPVISVGSTVDIKVAFGGKKEVVTAKDFKGGRVEVAFGGCELNLTQADFPGNEVFLSFEVTFGGAEIVVPSHWEVRNEIRPVFGGVEDHRSVHTAPVGENRKTLVLRGSVTFGSIEMKSF
jgi:predicted membrane protein